MIQDGKVHRSRKNRRLPGQSQSHINMKQEEQFQKVCFTISFEKQSQKKDLYLNAENEELLICDLNQMKKMILKAYSYPQNEKNKIEIHLGYLYPQNRQLYVPIKNSENYKCLMTRALQNQDRAIITIWVQVRVLKELHKKNIKKPVMQFDSDDSVQSEVDAKIAEGFQKNKPKFDKYKGDGLVRCAFCDKDSKDKEAKKLLGPFYGPFHYKKFVHLLCALWVYNVFLDHKFKLRGVNAAIKNANLKSCMFCSKNGAGLSCHNQKCLRKFNIHYECGLKIDIKYNWFTYTLLCPHCQQIQDKKQSQTIQNEMSKNESISKAPSEQLKQEDNI